MSTPQWHWKNQQGKCKLCQMAMKKRGRGDDVCVVNICPDYKGVPGLLCAGCNEVVGYIENKGIDAFLKIVGRVVEREGPSAVEQLRDKCAAYLAQSEKPVGQARNADDPCCDPTTASGEVVVLSTYKAQRQSL